MPEPGWAMVARPGLDVHPHFDVAGYFAALDATLASGGGAAPGATTVAVSTVAPAELARCYMQQWLDRSRVTRWGAAASALDVDEALELLAVIDLEGFGTDPERALRGRAPHALTEDAARCGLTVADLVQLVTTQVLARRRSAASGID